MQLYKLDFLKNNQEKFLLALGFFLVLSTGFFSGYFYLQSQVEKREIITEEPDQSCKDLFNSDPISNNPSSDLIATFFSQAGAQNNSENVSLQNKTGMFAASKNSNIYHKPDCQYAKRIKEENKIWFQSAEEAEKTGYKADKNCLGD